MASGSVKPPSFQMLAPTNHPKTRTLLLLKDYLGDDLSSCSSSGFRSLPRRQCCLHPRSSSSSAKSILQKASEALFNAIKSLAISSPPRSSPLPKNQRYNAKKGGGVLSRSLSRRLLSRSFWRRASKGGKHTLKSNANSNSWPESHFTCSLTDTEMERSLATATTNTCSLTNSTRDWPNEEKEQFSPVSVLNCPLFDDDEEITSPINSTSCSHLEGAKHKHVQKSRHFNLTSSVKPVTLEKNISWSELQEDAPIYNHPTKPCPLSVPIKSTQNGNSNLFRDIIEDNARDLLTHVKKSIPSVCLRIETEKGREIYITEMDKNGSWKKSDEEIQRLAMEIEVEFSTGLVNELVLDLITC